MITTQVRNLLIAVVCLFAGVEAQAQFKGSAEQYPTTDYSASPISFKLSEVATTLSTDAATLGTVLKEYVEAETPAALLFVQQPDGTETSAPSADANGFWMSATGQRLDYGEGCAFYASPDVDADADEFAFYVGQMPGVMQAGDVASAKIALKYNDKVATFEITLNVIAKPVYDIPEPTVIEKDLTIVGEASVTLEQYPRGGYDSDPLTVNIADVVEKLGLPSGDMLADALDQILYTTLYNTGDVEQGGGMKKDSLTNNPTGEGIGYWFRPVQNAEGAEDGEVAAAGWGADDKFYVNNFAYNAQTGDLTGVLGQYPGSCKDNEEWFAYVYLIYGNKAYRVKVGLKVLEKEQGNGLADYTKVGEGAAVTEQSPTDDFSTTQVSIDVEAIAAALGCEVSALGVYVLDDKDNFGGSTANNGGWWLNSAGTVTSYGTGAAFFIEPVNSGDWSVINVGQYPNSLNVGDEVSTTLNFVNGQNYYPFTVTLKIAEPQYVDQNFESVATRTFALQSLLDNGYTAMDLASIATEDIEAAIGTATPVFYGLAPDTLAAQTGEVYSKKWSCDPKPGFWLAKDGRVSKWGAESPVGICWVDNSTLRFFQYPNANSIGDTFTTQLFLVNEETNKMITLNINLSFVESLVESEIVGSENIALPVTSEGREIEIDLSKPAEALGVSVENLLDRNNYYLRGLSSTGVYGEGQNCENGLSFDMDGGYNSYGDLYFNIEKSGDKVVLVIGSNATPAADYSVDGQFCFEVENKQYVYYVKFVSETNYAGVTTIAAGSQKAGQTYDLLGRRVLQPVRGLYIQDGKKIVK
ncbi:MAG: DUF4859 domain-containing protein [Prevotella sp.]|nr:DUF4859 domain-containing protein [Prevotella sp.]